MPPLYIAKLFDADGFGHPQWPDAIVTLPPRGGIGYSPKQLLPEYLSNIYRLWLIRVRIGEGAVGIYERGEHEYRLKSTLTDGAIAMIAMPSMLPLDTPILLPPA